MFHLESPAPFTLKGYGMNWILCSSRRRPHPLPGDSPSGIAPPYRERSIMNNSPEREPGMLSEVLHVSFGRLAYELGKEAQDCRTARYTGYGETD